MFTHQQPKDIDPLLLSPKQASRALAISERTLFSLTKSRAIPAVRFGRSVRYDPRDLDAWIQAAKNSQKSA